MMLDRAKLRALVESILLEGVEEDRKYLIRNFPDYETEISELPNNAIKWLAARYGESPTVNDDFQFYRSLDAIISFVENESSLRGNAAKLKSAIASSNPGKNLSVTDPTKMSTSDIEKLINALMSLKASKGRTVDASRASNPENDVIARVGGWKISIATSRENSCALGLSNPRLCTTRARGNNLWARYIHDSILFTFTREGLEGEEAHDQMFIWTFGDNCEPRYGDEGGYGAETVDGSNNNIQERDIKKRLGPHFEEIKKILKEKCEQLGGRHPAYMKIEAATQSIQGLKDLTDGIKGSDLDDILSIVAKRQLSDEVEKAILTHPSGVVRSALALSRFASVSSLRQLANDEKNFVSMAAKQNPNFPTDDLQNKARETDDPVSWEMIAKTTDDLNILERIVSLKDESHSRARMQVASRNDLPNHLIDELKKDPSKIVRGVLAENPSMTPEFIRWVIDNDESIDIRARAVRNRSLPTSQAIEILSDNSLDAVIRLGGLSNPGVKNDIDVVKRFIRDPNPSVSLIAQNMYNRIMKEKGKNESRLRQLIRSML